VVGDHHLRRRLTRTARHDKRATAVGSPSTNRARQPLSFPRRARATISRVSDAWPPPGPQKREPLLEHVRDVWTLRYVETNCTAHILETTSASSMEAN
jgi:hypothetical protein